MIVFDRPVLTIADKEKIESYFKNAWYRYGCEKGWAETPREQQNFAEIGCKVTYTGQKKGEKLQENLGIYMTSSMSCEMSANSQKISAIGSLQIWDLIRKAEKEPYYDEKLREYINAVKGRPNMHWSKNLLKLSERNEKEPQGELLYTLTADGFKRLARNEGTLKILEAVENEDLDIIRYYIDEYDLTPAQKAAPGQLFQEKEKQMDSFLRQNTPFFRLR